MGFLETFLDFGGLSGYTLDSACVEVAFHCLFLLSWAESDMAYDCIVLAKQVPDTKNITGRAMKEDGTVNRAALPAIFNPEDLNALEMALTIKDTYGGTVRLISMGPPSAGEILRQALYRGADDAVLLTDRKFAAADTLATSYALSCAIRRMGRFDIVLCGRQAIDGDTAQVGPQTAEKLGIAQVTYVTGIRLFDGETIELERTIEDGYEAVRTRTPVLLTVCGEANEPRPPRAKLLLQYRSARSPSELIGIERRRRDEAGETVDMDALVAEMQPRIKELRSMGLLLNEWKVDDIGADPSKCGGSGSPTKVKKIESIVLAGNELEWIEPDEEGLRGLVKELVEDHILG